MPDPPCADARALGKMPQRVRPLSQIQATGAAAPGTAPSVHPPAPAEACGPQGSMPCLVSAQAHSAPSRRPAGPVTSDFCHMKCWSENEGYRVQRPQGGPRFCGNVVCEKLGLMHDVISASSGFRPQHLRSLGHIVKTDDPPALPLEFLYHLTWGTCLRGNLHLLQRSWPSGAEGTGARVLGQDGAQGRIQPVPSPTLACASIPA